MPCAQRAGAVFDLEHYTLYCRRHAPRRMLAAAGRASGSAAAGTGPTANSGLLPPSSGANLGLDAATTAGICPPAQATGADSAAPAVSTAGGDGSCALQIAADRAALPADAAAARTAAEAAAMAPSEEDDSVPVATGCDSHAARDGAASNAAELVEAIRYDTAVVMVAIPAEAAISGATGRAVPAPPVAAGGVASSWIPALHGADDAFAKLPGVNGAQPNAAGGAGGEDAAAPSRGAAKAHIPPPVAHNGNIGGGMRSPGASGSGRPSPTGARLLPATATGSATLVSPAGIARRHTAVAFRSPLKAADVDMYGGDYAYESSSASGAARAKENRPANGSGAGRVRGPDARDAGEMEVRC